MYKEICESEDFLSHMDSNQYSNLLSRDYLCSPSETIRLHIRNAVDQIQEEKVDDTVAAKVIGAVLLGLVDIREMIKSSTIPEI